MRWSATLLLLCGAVLGPGGTVSAASVDDLARKNCVAEIVRSTDVDRNAVKGFRFSKQGGGYVMRGQDDNHRTVTCETAADGHVLMVSVN